MNIYFLTFKGLWLGGTAVIKAKTEDEAKEILINHPDFQNEWIESIEIDKIPHTEKVLYIDNGNY